MIVNGKHYTSIWRNEKKQVFIIDQRILPHEFKIVELKNLSDFCIAIKDMLVRGALLSVLLQHMEWPFLCYLATKRMILK